MNIGTICFYYPHLGGSGIIASRIAKEIALQSKNNSIIISYENTENPKEMEEAGIKLYTAQDVSYGCLKSKPHIETLVSKTLEAIKKENLDLIHSHYLVPHAIVGNIVKQIEGIPHITTIHGTDMHTLADNPGLKPILEWSLKNANYVTFVSEYLKNKCESIFETDFNGKVIPNFVDNNIFKKQKNGLRKELNIPEDATVIIHASNFRPIKNTIPIGWAARKLIENNKEHQIYFIFVGDSNAEDYLRLKKDIEYSNSSKYFKFLIKQDTIAPLLAESDIAILNSTREGCPLFILEALSSNIPVVSSSVGGVPEIIKHNYNGLLYEKGNQDEMVKALQTLVENRELRRKMGERGLETIIEKFSKEKIMNDYKEIYQKIINQQK